MGKTLKRSIPKRNELSGCRRKFLGAIALLFVLTASTSNAQSQTEKTSPVQPSATTAPPTPTLHVYTNLKQVPVLVLSSDYQRMNPIDPSRFRISLDSGPRFRPTYVRREGEDPISMAILIDASNPDNELLPSLIKAIASLPPDYLHPQDRVSVYAIDCTLIRTTYDSAANPAVLADGVQRAMAPWQIRQTQNEELKKEKKALPPPCRTRLPLWDSMENVLDDLIQQPGRRVLLAITDGKDTGSKTLWTDVMFHAQIHSVTVFGLVPTPTFVAQKSNEAAIFHIDSPYYNGTEDKFGQICVNSGGIPLHANEHITMFRLKEFTQMLRERYILEFPRSTNEEAGVHTIAVSYRKRNNLYIAATGITVPIASEDEKESMKTMQADPSRTPQSGTRKVLPKF